MIRIESPDGTKRLELSSSDSLAALYDKVFDQFKIDATRRSEYCLFADRNRKLRIPENRNTRVKETISHGDFVYLLPAGGETNGQRRDQIEFGEEDQVDLDLAKQDGKIHRPRDEQL